MDQESDNKQTPPVKPDINRSKHVSTAVQLFYLQPTSLRVIETYWEYLYVGLTVFYFSTINVANSFPII